MSILLDLWNNNRTQLEKMRLEQIITLAGDGKLLDGSDTSKEFREFLRKVSLSLLWQYSDDCLKDKFDKSGLVLQDIVNQVGSRLDFKVTHGRYQGTKDQSGQDGLWINNTGHAIVVEVKTTDAYRIKLETVDKYRQSLAKNGTLQLEKSSMLIVVGREDTGDLEAQIRGSRFAQNMRVVSIDALLKILKLMEDVETPSLIKKVHSILLPNEFTKLDPIIDIAFDAVEDTKREEDTQWEMELREGAAENEVEVEGADQKKAPVAFRDECISRVEKNLGGISLIKRTKTFFKTAEETAPEEETTAVVSAVSKYHEKPKWYWFGFSNQQDELLSKEQNAYVAFGCGDADTLFLIPFPKLKQQLDNFSETKREDRSYWHISIRESNGSYLMLGKSGKKDFDITKFKI